MKSPDDWAGEYDAMRPAYEAFSQKLEVLLLDMIRELGIPVAHHESRAKTKDSVAGKIERKYRSEPAPLERLTDFAGVRLVTYYLEDSTAIGELIADQFEIDEPRSENKKDRFDPDRFGYLSDHYIVKIKPPRSGLPEWMPFRELVAEVQVRTATQHAWAAVEHRLGYKKATQLPDDLRRRLYRLSALFELADEQFSEVRISAENTQATYRASLQGGHDVPLDLSSLEAYTASPSRELNELIRWIEGDGCEVRTDVGDDGAGRRQRDRSDLLELSTQKNLRSVSALNGVLTDPRLPAQLSDLNRSRTVRARFIEDWLTLAVLLATGDLESDEWASHTYGEGFAAALRRARAAGSS